MGRVNATQVQGGNANSAFFLHMAFESPPATSWKHGRIALNAIAKEPWQSGRIDGEAR
jgi:hypothetical protein